MNIEKNKVVSVTYKLNVKNATQPEERFIEETNAENPLTFLMGSGNLLEAFEHN
ncbi:MAG: hypothetical protein J0M08_05945 [Bacteroidetes bacterium]|nr:hypothetical protein [Bacteroidota bacterium]